MKNFLLSIALIASSGFALADTTPNACIGVIINSKEDISKFSSKTETLQEIDSFCRLSENYTSSKMNAELAGKYDFITGSAEAQGSITTGEIENARNEFCSDSDKSQAKAHAYNELIRNINPLAFKSYDQCLKMYQQGIKVRILSTSVKKIQFDVQFTSEVNNAASADIVYVFNYTGTDTTAGCTWFQKGVAVTGRTVTVPNGTTSTMTCDRPLIGAGTDPKSTALAHISIVRTNSSSEHETFTFKWLPTDQYNIPLSGIAQNKINIGTNDTDIAKNKTQIEALYARPSVFLKPGNNGSVSCNTYCKGSQWAGGTGTCLGTKSGENCSYTGSPEMTCICVSN